MCLKLDSFGKVKSVGLGLLVAAGDRMELRTFVERRGF
jgi:hypothetical protein